MVRPAASDVSALWGFVANGCQASITFPLPPLKFRTVDFLQYGFKPVAPGATFATAHTGGTFIRDRSSFGPVGHLAAHCVEAGTGPCGRSGPEALGSASGYSVPSRRRLLWPHPRLWSAPDGFPFRYPVGSLLTSRGPEGP